MAATRQGSQCPKAPVVGGFAGFGPFFAWRHIFSLFLLPSLQRLLVLIQTPVNITEGRRGRASPQRVLCERSPSESCFKKHSRAFESKHNRLARLCKSVFPSVRSRHPQSGTFYFHFAAFRLLRGLTLWLGAFQRQIRMIGLHLATGYRSIIASVSNQQADLIHLIRHSVAQLTIASTLPCPYDSRGQGKANQSHGCHRIGVGAPSCRRQSSSGCARCVLSPLAQCVLLARIETYIRVIVFLYDHVLCLLVGRIIIRANQP